MTVNQWFPRIAVLRIFVKTILVAFKSHLKFLLKEKWDVLRL